jgi:hypothetical protein
MTLAIPAVGDVIILSIEYAPDGLSWARLWDNHALGWLIDETVVAPPVTRAKPPDPVVTGKFAPFPLILGSMAVPAPDTSPVISPQWGKFVHPPAAVFIPDLLRLSFSDFLTWLATNNGVRRPLGQMVGLSNTLLNGFNQWSASNPTLSFQGDPPPSGPPPSVRSRA